MIQIILWVNPMGYRKAPQISVDTRNIKGSSKPDTSESIALNNHDIANQISTSLVTGLKESGLKIGERATLKLIDGAIGHLINASNEQSALSGMTTVSGLGVNTSTITRTNYDIGLSTTKKLKRQANTPLVEFHSKVLASSHKDYIQHTKRKNLTLSTGFEQKGYSFLMNNNNYKLSNCYVSTGVITIISL